MVGEESIQMRETKNVMVSRDLSPFPRHSSSPAGSVSIRPLGQIRVECGDKEGEREAFDPNSPPADRDRGPRRCQKYRPTVFPASHDLSVRSLAAIDGGVVLVLQMRREKGNGNSPPQSQM